jgi:thioredoxin reductase (NADPH)
MSHCKSGRSLHCGQSPMSWEQSMSTEHARVIILGSGPAGYTAAVYAARAMLAPVMIAGIQPGGQLTITTDVENYPGFADAVQGPWLMDEMRRQAERFGTRIVSDHVATVDLSQRPFVLRCDSGAVWRCDALIIATGAQARWLGLPGEERFKGFGVSACATCDGFFFRGKEVVVVGGGNTAVEEALFLTNFATKVTLVHRRDRLRAERILHDRLLANPKAEIRWNSVVEDIVGGGTPLGVTGVRLRDTVTGEVSELATDGVFVAIGHEPATAALGGQLELTPAGYVKIVPGTSLTGVPGVFAAGDVTDDVYRQAVTAAGMGCMAALDAERFLAAEDARRIAAE